jgi:hypothetical protein
MLVSRTLSQGAVTIPQLMHDYEPALNQPTWRPPAMTVHARLVLGVGDGLWIMLLVHTFDGSAARI